MLSFVVVLFLSFSNDASFDAVFMFCFCSYANYYSSVKTSVKELLSRFLPYVHSVMCLFVISDISHFSFRSGFYLVTC